MDPPWLSASKCLFAQRCDTSSASGSVLCFSGAVYLSTKHPRGCISALTMRTFGLRAIQPNIAGFFLRADCSGCGRISIFFSLLPEDSSRINSFSRLHPAASQPALYWYRTNTTCEFSLLGKPRFAELVQTPAPRPSSEHPAPPSVLLPPHGLHLPLLHRQICKFRFSCQLYYAFNALCARYRDGKQYGSLATAKRRRSLLGSFPEPHNRVSFLRDTCKSASVAGGAD